MVVDQPWCGRVVSLRVQTRRFACRVVACDWMPRKTPTSRACTPYAPTIAHAQGLIHGFLRLLRERDQAAVDPWLDAAATLVPVLRAAPSPQTLQCPSPAVVF